MIYNFSEHKEKKQSNFMETLEKKLQDTSSTVSPYLFRTKGNI